MNDIQHVEAARALAQRALLLANLQQESPQQLDTVRARIAWMWRTVTARHPSSQELDIASQAFMTHLGRYSDDEKAAKELITYGESPVPEECQPAELAALTMVANLILNLDETVSKN